MELLGGFRAIKSIIWLLFIYNLVCIFAFSLLYKLVGFSDHFELNEGVEDAYPTALYFSFATQATCMAGEIYPKTRLGRGIMSFQILSAWLVTLVLIVPWIKMAR